ncbi:VOC family protein [Luteimonas sp. BDR2-5]|uniref:VOC family protein n=1 Tax=Proluteimonas luteida TaxID=2878685 RepID=UPI001E6562BB|nr:VOC family protein [Luteimonas sp. BDR2-5]MCD9028377.1 VOC family protein [Luteimonas sp. BDR2-5]
MPNTIPSHDAFGELPRGIHHLGMTVPDVDAATTFLRAALGATVCYDGVAADDPPREGAELERVLGLPAGAKILRQRMVRIGTGPGLELFEIQAPSQQAAAALQDIGLNHLAVYVDDIDAAVKRLVAAGATMLSEVHGNSRYEDTPGNGSVYARAPWGSLIELQSIPGGYYYPPDSESEVWLPPRR